ncbi:MerR family transcriptional regulator [uncultured Pseudokineococcus sp.]|uniref:MerR family transcriptional regulator n=1 Tax=uncultured Pseudokineococcus sp. TaxID=1642928 RepID=UPI00261FFE5F|nr:MerR family transcriptional regulator [uncultured Pseudokineococcus sp.]
MLDAVVDGPLDPDGCDGYTVAEVAALVGMSVRNVRAYQARGLLSPPSRHNRCARYSAAHVERIRAIQLMQRRGFNLAAIQVTLGDPAADVVAEDASPEQRLLERLDVTSPAAVDVLQRIGVLRAGVDGCWEVLEPEALRAVSRLVELGADQTTATAVLCRLLEGLSPLAKEVLGWIDTHVPAGGDRRSGVQEVVATTMVLAIRRHASDEALLAGVAPLPWVVAGGAVVAPAQRAAVAALPEVRGPGLGHLPAGGRRAPHEPLAGGDAVDGLTAAPRRRAGPRPPSSAGVRGAAAGPVSGPR